MLKEHNWNIYKLFKNGKRAKLPTCQIIAETAVEAEKIFLEEFLTALPKKYSNYNWVYVHEDDNQTREYERDCEHDAKFKRIRELFFARQAAKLGNIPNNIAIALVMSKCTDWKWQWAACQPATSKYLAGLSPQFDSSLQADAWLRESLDGKI